MFEQTFKNIDDKLWKDAGCSSELDYVEQTSWILFLKYLDDLEKDRKDDGKKDCLRKGDAVLFVACHALQQFDED